MKKENDIKIFEEKKVRTLWDPEQEKWYFSIVDVVAVLTGSVGPNAYWRKLKQRLHEEGNETVTNCHGLKICPRWQMRVWIKYWSVLITSLKAEGSQLTTICSQLKMQSTYGRLGRGYNAGTSIAYTFGIFIGRKFSGTSYEMYYSTTKE